MKSKMTNDSITVRCGDLRCQLSRQLLIQHSGYFRTLLQGAWADSDQSECTLDPQMIQPDSLQLILKSLTHSDLSWVPFLDESRLLRAALACEALQMKRFESIFWSSVASKFVPGNCILDTKFFYLPSCKSITFVEQIWSIFQWKFFEHCWPEDVLCDLSEAELFWILRNPNIVDPTGGVLALILIDTYVRHQYDMLYDQMHTKSDNAEDVKSFSDGGCGCDGTTAKNNSGESKPECQNLSKEAKAMTSRLVFALLESIEARVTKDSPEGFVRRAILPSIGDESSDECSRSELGSPKGEKQAPNSYLSSLEDVGVVGEEFFSELKLPLTRKDVNIIKKHLEDDNVFAYMYRKQKKTSWKACFVASAKRESRRLNSDGCVSIISFDEEAQSFDVQLRDLKTSRPSNICAYGQDMFVVTAQDKKKVTDFGSVRSYNWRSRKWRNIHLTRPLPQGSSIMCWLASRGLSLYPRDEWSGRVVATKVQTLLASNEGAGEALINASLLALRRKYALDYGKIVVQELRASLEFASGHASRNFRAQAVANTFNKFDPILDYYRTTRDSERQKDSQHRYGLFFLSACTAPYLRIKNPYNTKVYKAQCKPRRQLSILKQLKGLTTAETEEYQERDETFELTRNTSPKRVRLHAAPVHPGAERKSNVFTVGNHCLLFFLCSLYIKCPGKLYWRKLSLFRPHVQISPRSFRAVIPFGIGVYIVADHGYVYFMPLRTFKCETPATHHTCNPDVYYSLSLILFPYAKLKTDGHQVCRVQDKLYIAGGSSDQKDKLPVEVLQLLYNPLEPTGDIEETPDPASVPFVESLFEEQRLNDLELGVSTTHEGSRNQHDRMSSKDSNERTTEKTAPALSRDVDPSAAATPDGETVLPDVMPSASSIRRAAATQHRLMDRGVLKPVLNFYQTAPLISEQLSPAGLLALSLLEEMKSNFYPNWTIEETDHFNLPEEDRFFENDECRWCRNVSKLWPMPAECNPAQQESTVIEVTNSEWTCVSGSMNDGRANDCDSFTILAT